MQLTKVLTRCCALKYRCRIGNNYRIQSATAKMTSKPSSTYVKPSGKAHFQIFGPCGGDSVPILFLFTDTTRYVFNCSEGTQRLFTEYKVKFGKLEKIFLTGITWDHIGGLPGMAMTLRDIGKPKIGVYSPHGITEILDASRPFLKHEKVEFNCVEFTEGTETPYQDHELLLQPIVIKCPSHRAEDKSADNIREPHDIMDTTNGCIPKQPGTQDTICYVGSLPRVPGKFLPKKAMALGVPKGPLFGELQTGSVVTLKDGREIKPEDVMEPGEPPPSFAIIDCPSEQHIPQIIGHQGFKNYMTDGELPFTVMIHMVRTDLYKNKEYQDWLKSFPDTTFHWICDKELMGSTETVLKSQRNLCKQFNLVDPVLFPEIESWKDQQRRDRLIEHNDKQKVQGQSLSRFYFRPKQLRGFSHPTEENPSPKEQKNGPTTSLLLLNEHMEPVYEATKGTTHLNENVLGNCEDGTHLISTPLERTHNVDESIILEPYSESDSTLSARRENTDDTFTLSYQCKRKHSMPEFEDLSLKTENTFGTCTCTNKGDLPKRVKANDLDCNESSDVDCLLKLEPYPRVIFLGTGAALPSKYRNVTGILVQIEEGHNFFFDCGEGTYSQLMNHFGTRTPEIIRDLKGVFISHLHADHHLGLIRVLEHHTRMLEEKDSNMEPLVIIAPGPLYTWLNGYAKVGGRYKYRPMICRKLTDEFQIDFSFPNEHLPGLTKVQTIEVDHGTIAYGIKLTHESGWTLTYSGDTMPSENLIKEGRNSTFLIHEATLEDGLEEEAKEKHHSTLSQALQVASKMNSKYTVLTHFSQRYPKLPVINDTMKHTVAIAFDHMEISPMDFPRMSAVLPKLIKMFEEAEEQ